jgi:hypothetical protein
LGNPPKIKALQIRSVHLFALITRLVFLAGGLYFLLGPYVLHKVPEQTQRIFGGLLIGYGAFRAFMVWRQIKRENKPTVHNEEE